MLHSVTMMDGGEMVINSDQIVLCGPVTADGQPIIGSTKVLLLGGAAMIVREGLDEFKNRINRERRTPGLPSLV